jgi:predicted DNA-binding transcriptional regulator
MENQDLTNVLVDHKLRKKVGFTIIEAAVFEQIEIYKKSVSEASAELDVSRTTVYHSVWRLQKKGYLQDVFSNMGKIYLAIDENTGYYKIGWSKNPSKREKTLQSEKPTIKFLITIDGRVQDESYLHKVFGAKRIRGEWFAMDSQDVNRFLLEIEMIKSKYNQ